jgi:hypothetical protein
VDVSRDAIRLLIGARAMAEYKIASIHKTADVTIQTGKRPDWFHWITTSANVSNNTRLYQNGMTVPSTRARALAAAR